MSRLRVRCFLHFHLHLLGLRLVTHGGGQPRRDRTQGLRARCGVGKAGRCRGGWRLLQQPAADVFLTVDPEFPCSGSSVGRRNGPARAPSRVVVSSLLAHDSMRGQARCVARQISNLLHLQKEATAPTRRVKSADAIAHYASQYLRSASSSEDCCKKDSEVCQREAHGSGIAHMHGRYGIR